MARTIRIRAGQVQALAELNDSATADAVWQALPLESQASTWGDEIYFSITVQQSYENPQELVQAGDLGYWPPGTAFCIFFGPTPASGPGEIRPASAVNLFGRIISPDPKEFKRVASGEKVAVERVKDEG